MHFNQEIIRTKNDSNHPPEDYPEVDPKFHTYEAGATRLYNGLKPQIAYYVPLPDGTQVNYPAKKGIDLETATLQDCIDWMEDKTIEKGIYKFWFVVRFMVCEFPDMKIQIRNSLTPVKQLEFDKYHSKPKENKISWLGEIDYGGFPTPEGEL